MVFKKKKAVEVQDVKTEESKDGRVLEVPVAPDSVKKFEGFKPEDFVVVNTAYAEFGNMLVDVIGLLSKINLCLEENGKRLDRLVELVGEENK